MSKLIARDIRYLAAIAATPRNQIPPRYLRGTDMKLGEHDYYYPAGCLCNACIAERAEEHRNDENLKLTWEDFAVAVLTVIALALILFTAIKLGVAIAT